MYKWLSLKFISTSLSLTLIYSFLLSCSCSLFLNVAVNAVSQLSLGKDTPDSVKEKWESQQVALAAIDRDLELVASKLKE